MGDARVLHHADQVVPGGRLQPLAVNEERKVLPVRVAVANEELEQRPPQQGQARHGLVDCLLHAVEEDFKTHTFADVAHMLAAAKVSLVLVHRG